MRRTLRRTPAARDPLVQGTDRPAARLSDRLPEGLVDAAWLWLVMRVGLGLIAPRNSTSIIAMLTCALSMSAAVFLILEMNHPLDGLIKVSSAPLEAALVVISK